MASILSDEDIYRARILNDDRQLRSLAKKLSNLATAQTQGEGEQQLPNITALYVLFNAEVSSFFNTHFHRSANSTSAAKLDSDSYADTLRNIQKNQESTRESLQTLAAELQQAQITRDNKITYDSIAQNINALPTRDASIATINRLTQEIAELQAEEEQTKQVWERRQQGFDYILNQLVQLGDEVREEKSEQERRVLMDEDQEVAEPTLPNGENADQTTENDNGELNDGGSEEGEAHEGGGSPRQSRQTSPPLRLNPTAQPFHPSNLRKSVTASGHSREDGEVEDVLMQSVDSENSQAVDREEGEEDD